MAGTIIFLTISFFVSVIFVILGIFQWNSKVPVGLNTEEKPPGEDELIDMTEWNHKHGRNLIIYGCVLFITLTVFVFLIEKITSVLLQITIFLIVIVMELVWIEVQHISLKKKLIKK